MIYGLAHPSLESVFVSLKETIKCNQDAVTANTLSDPHAHNATAPVSIQEPLHFVSVGDIRRLLASLQT